VVKIKFELRPVDVIIVFAFLMAIEVAGNYFEKIYTTISPELVFWGSIAIILLGLIWRIKT